MGKTLPLIGLVIIGLYVGVNYWIGRRIWQLCGRFIPLLDRKVYWALYWLIAAAYWVGRYSTEIMPSALNRWFVIAGAYWLAAIYYFGLVFAVFDLLRWVNKRRPFVPTAWQHRRRLVAGFGFSIVLFVTGLVAYGGWNALNPAVCRYDVTIAKSGGALAQLHIVAVSDLHLGTIVHHGRLTKLVGMIQELQPDVVLLVGDVIDENVGPFVAQDMAAIFRQMQPPYGLFAVPGNHEYIGRQWDQVFARLQAAGVRVLRDETVKVADAFYLVGRDDHLQARITGYPRLELGELLAQVDKALPVIVLDHQPLQLAAAQREGVDLQFSGHTHRGQLFPNNLITRRMFETDWGLLCKDSLQVIVSAGFGTWGPPVRIGNTPEIVDVMVHFTPENGAR